MKEILFRGKRVDNDEWIYGFYFESTAGGVKHSYIKYETWDEGFVTYEVRPETIGQLTGLTDKEGKRIFEGDIIIQYYEVAPYHEDSHSGYHVGGVKISAWNGVHLKDPISHNNETGDSTKVHYSVNVCGARCKITGNIYDNPDLLMDKRALYLGEINKSTTVEKVDSIIDDAVLDTDITLKGLHSIYAAAYNKIKELK